MYYHYKSGKGEPKTTATTTTATDTGSRDDDSLSKNKTHLLHYSSKVFKAIVKEDLECQNDWLRIAF